jgi:tetratricopeptide (TPR) repeat protein
VARGNAHFLKSNLDRAMADFESALALNPSHAPALAGRGRVWRKRGDDAKALADFDRAIALDAKSIESLFARADIYAERRNSDAALADLRRVIELKPRDPFELLAQVAARAKIKAMSRDTCGGPGMQRDERCL